MEIECRRARCLNEISQDTVVCKDWYVCFGQFKNSGVGNADFEKTFASAGVVTGNRVFLHRTDKCAKRCENPGSIWIGYLRRQIAHLTHDRMSREDFLKSANNSH